MSYEQQKQLESDYMIGAYGRKPVEFVRGEGMYLYDSTGKRYTDFLSGIGVVCLGHAEPTVSAALAEQAQKLMHVSNFFYIEGRGELARDLSLLLNNKDSHAAPWKTFFCNSGAEANEGAIKLARKYGKLHLDGAGTVLTAKRSFHGRTLVTTAATGQVAKQESFAPMPDGFAHFDPTDIEDFKRVLEGCKQAAAQKQQAELAPVAVLLECVQGEGGVLPLDAAFLQEVRALTEQQQMLLIIDEVQTGFYRTGSIFSYQQAAIRPDVVTLAKALANGFPCGAFAATGKAADIFAPGEHGTTFGGGPLAIAAARATLKELERLDIVEQVAKNGSYLKEQLALLPQVSEVRGKGLMTGATLTQPCAVQVVDQALQRGMVFNSIGENIIRFLPPLIVGKEHIDALVSVLKELLEEL